MSRPYKRTRSFIRLVDAQCSAESRADHHIFANCNKCGVSRDQALVSAWGNPGRRSALRIAVERVRCSFGDYASVPFEAFAEDQHHLDSRHMPAMRERRGVSSESRHLVARHRTVLDEAGAQPHRRTNTSLIVACACAGSIHVRQPGPAGSKRDNRFHEFTCTDTGVWFPRPLSTTYGSAKNYAKGTPSARFRDSFRQKPTSGSSTGPTEQRSCP